MRSIAARGHQADEVIFAARSKRREEQELSLVFAWQAGDDVSRRNRVRSAVLSSDMARQIPKVFLVIEALRIEHVVRAVDLRLHAKENFGVASVGPEIGRHLRFGAEERWKQPLISADEGI